MAPDELVGFAEVAEMFGVSKKTARKYVRHTAFPKPLGQLKSGPVWRRVHVEQWGTENLPLRAGRPPRADAVP